MILKSYQTRDIGQILCDLFAGVMKNWTFRRCSTHGKDDEYVNDVICFCLVSTVLDCHDTNPSELQEFLFWIDDVIIQYSALEDMVFYRDGNVNWSPRECDLTS